MHQPVAEIAAFFRRQQFPQGHFHLIGVFYRNQAHTPADADAVGIRHNGGFVENIPHNQVGGFPANAGKLGQLLNGIGEFPAVIPQKHLGDTDNIFGLGAE